MTTPEQLATIMQQIENRYREWLARDMTDEEVEEFSEIKFELTLNSRKFPSRQDWLKDRNAAYDELLDWFLGTTGNEDFQLLIEAVLEEDPKAALEALERAISVLAKCRVRDRT